MNGYKEAMSTAYLSGDLTQAGLNANDPAQQTFKKTLDEKTGFINDVEISYRDDKAEKYTNNKAEKMDRNEQLGEKTDRPDRPDRSAEEATRKDNDRQVKEQKHQEDNETKGEQDNPKKKTDAKQDAASGEKVNQNDDGNNNDKGTATKNKTDLKSFKGQLKEIVKENAIKTDELENVKTDMEETFTEGQKVKSNNHSEKVMLKDTDGQGKTEGEGEKGAENAKTSEEANLDKKLMSELEGEKKAATQVKTEPKAVKEGPAVDNNLNITPVQDRTPQLQNEIKVQKLLDQNANPEQARMLKDQIVGTVENNIKMMISEGDNKVSIQLHPPELGKVQVELVVKDNRIDARINTENVAVKEVILNNLNQLKVNIEELGISINKFDVEVGGFKNHFDGQFDEGDANGGGGTGQGGGSEVLEDSDWLPDKVIRQQALSMFLGSSINYLV